MTSLGGTSFGTLFTLHTDGSNFTVLKDLDTSTGDYPYDGSALMEAADGSLLGTTGYGGVNDEGAVFQCAKDGSNFTVLASFDDSGDSGTHPCGLTEGSDGNFYGTSAWGSSSASSANGAIWRLTLHPASWTNGVADLLLRDYAVADVLATWSNYGSGLAGTLGVPTLVSRADPVIGKKVTLQVSNSRGVATGATLFLGLSRANLPLKGGTLLVGNVFFLFTTVIPPPSLTFSGDLPDDPALAGLVLDLQFLEADPGATKGLSFTPGLELALGY
jgi:uncharacterized repeat protein (TIGR03803 family)